MAGPPRPAAVASHTGSGGRDRRCQYARWPAADGDQPPRRPVLRRQERLTTP